MTRIVYWPETDTQRLKVMWWNGKTVRQCADALERTNLEMVRDKIDREGFIRNPQLYQKEPPLDPATREDGTLVTIRDVRDRECRWIAGPASSDAVMCGRPVFRRALCEAHWIRGHEHGARARL